MVLRLHGMLVVDSPFHRSQVMLVGAWILQQQQVACAEQSDEENMLSYTASALGVGLDSLSINTGLIVYPTENFAGYIDIMVIASDTYGASVADTMMLTIENINDAR